MNQQRQSILEVIDDHGDGWDAPFLAVACPVCGKNYQHLGAPAHQHGNDAYAAPDWEGRGDLVIVPFWGECGHTWRVCFGYHKGNTVVFVEILTAEAA